LSYISINNLSFCIEDKNILNNINIDIKKDEFVSIAGKNGSGKTTLAKIMTGILKPTMGIVTLDGIDVSSMPLFEVGRKVGYLFQNPERQIFATTVFEELCFAMKFKHVPNEIIDEKVEEIIHRFDLEDIRDSNTFLLSYGEKQRLAIAAIVLNNAEYLILDEPSTGLDSIRKSELSKMFFEIRNKGDWYTNDQP
jgi:energy-coupling factor transport system ATP-binding protein